MAGFHISHFLAKIYIYAAFPVLMDNDCRTNSITFDELLRKSDDVFIKNFSLKVWFGRCIFLSWYCDVGTCKFCFRSTQKDRIKFAQHARRTKESVITEALLAKKLGWRIEFLTGGYGIYDINELALLARLASIAYGERIWLNLGVLKKDELMQFVPYIKGVVASIETIDNELHDSICPNKPIAPYVEMFELIERDESLRHLKKSMTMVVGLGEKKEHFILLKNFIEKHNLDRMTFYALKPIKGTPYTDGPSTEDYAWWIAMTRIAFPKLEIIAGTTADRVGEVDIILKAGANAITKFPATKLFGTEKAKILSDKVGLAGRQFTSNLTILPEIDWDKDIDLLDIDCRLKEKVKIKMRSYIDVMKRNELVQLECLKNSPADNH
jgi:biotin synthase-like enzyme